MLSRFHFSVQVINHGETLFPADKGERWLPAIRKKSCLRKLNNLSTLVTIAWRDDETGFIPIFRDPCKLFHLHQPPLGVLRHNKISQFSLVPLIIIFRQTQSHDRGSRSHHVQAKVSFDTEENCDNSFKRKTKT